MNRLRFFRLVPVALVLLALGAERASSQSALAALRIPVGAIEAGRSGAGVAALAEPGAVRFNPAAATGVEGIAVQVSGVDWFADINLASAMLTWPAAGGRWSAWVTDTDLGEFERRGEQPTTLPDGIFTASQVEAALSYGRAIPWWNGSVGVTVRGVTETIDTDRVVGAGLDLGGIVGGTLGGYALTFGAAVRHLGSKFGPGADPLPQTWAAGVRVGSPDARLATYADLETVSGAGSGAQVGIDVEVAPALRCRVGRALGVEGEGYAAGFDASLQASGIQLIVAYAFTDMAFDLESTHRLQVGLGF